MPFLAKFMGFEAKAPHSGPQRRETRAVKTGPLASVQMSASSSVYRAGCTANEQEAKKDEVADGAKEIYQYFLVLGLASCATKVAVMRPGREVRSG